MKEKFDEILDDVKTRIKNPLILSFILVWLYYHWAFVYELITIDVAIPFNSRSSVFRHYVNEQGWNGMVGKPIGVAFLTLIIYYLIAIASQLIKVLVGKNLYAAIFSRLDKANYVSVTELEIEKKHNKILKEQFEKANKENIGLMEYKSENENTVNKLSREINELRININHNLEFRKEFEFTMLILLAKAQGITTQEKQETIIDQLDILNGNWKVYHNKTMMQKGTGTLEHLVFKDNVVTNFEGQDYGLLRNMTIEKKTKFYKFSIDRSIAIANKTDQYNLIRVNRNEFIGFRNDEFCYLERNMIENPT